jgi:hypothetical protein
MMKGSAVAGSIDCLGEGYAIEVLECFRDMARTAQHLRWT